MTVNFTRADHTLIFSDIHLADAEPKHEHNPLWKRFKRRAHFIDHSLKACIEDLRIPGGGRSRADFQRRHF